MTDLLDRAYGLLTQYPQWGVALVAVAVVILFAWGVVSTSHRYR